MGLARDSHSLDTSREFLDEALKSFYRAKDLTQQLLTFSKGGVPVKRVMRLEKLLTESVAFALSGSPVNAEFNIEEGLAAVDIDEGQIYQVVNNIVINARQAMPLGGTIAVNAAMCQARDAPIPVRAGGQAVRIAISDTGVGIPQELLEKIFDPFFTTKQKGSGLGLAISFSIVKKHNGHITVSSVQGKGSMFTIYLPAVEEHLADDREQNRMLLRKPGTVLVMDDEEQVLRVTRHILEREGFTVLSAPDGETAIEIFKEAMSRNDVIDVVILDLTVTSGMGGKEAVAKLREIDPKVRAIVSSGYSDDPVLADPGAYGFYGVIAKPYKMEDLLEAIERACISG
jgi:CheY-like chemotaxis protein